MNIALRTGALALALLAGTVMTAAPAMADRGHHDRSWGKSWNKKYYQHNRHRGHARKGRGWNNRYGWDRRYGHRHDRYGYRRPAYGWFYGAPGFSIHIR
ncbi:MAG: hypothetical protein ACSLE4_05625 [Methyloceanibacter sp.]|uniref:hypothetical protein n=1 Tax=Methyloceanibacter sp. TaxID=1965321 RepID=UPI003EDFBE6F